MWEYRATVVRWQDGDTLDADVDLGFRITTHLRLRLARLDTEELRSGDADQRRRGQMRKMRSEMLAPAGSTITVQTQKDTPSGGFDRYLAEVLTADGRNI